jgi:hypothetical protein
MKAHRSAGARAQSPHVRQTWVEKDRQGLGQARWRDGRMRHLEQEYQAWRRGRWQVFADELEGGEPTPPVDDGDPRS